MFVHVPFQPDDVWGKKPVHHVSGRIGPCDSPDERARRIRETIELLRAGTKERPR